MSDATSSLRQNKLPLILALLHTKSQCDKQALFCTVHAGRDALSCGAQNSPVNMGQSSASSTVPFTSSSFLSLQSNRCLFISVINQLDAQNFCFTLSLFHASTCFEHM